MSESSFWFFIACCAVTGCAVAVFMFAAPATQLCRRCGIWLIPGREETTCAACQAEEQEGR